MFEKIAIIGLGLIGGSLAKAFRENNMCSTIIGIDLCDETLRSALINQSIDLGYNNIRQGVEEADLIIISVPISNIKQALKDVFKYAKKNTWVLDVGSVKGVICEAVDNLLNERDDIIFIGGHPMAGSEKSGFENSDSNIFKGASFILIPKNITLEENSDFMKWLKNIHVKIVIMNDDAHDLNIGYVSHLPHLISAAMINTINHHTKIPSEVFCLSGNGFKDTTRISDSDPNQWADICLYNDQINLIFDCFLQEIEQLKILLSNKNREFLYKYFLEAKTSRNKCLDLSSCES